MAQRAIRRQFVPERFSKSLELRGLENRQALHEVFATHKAVRA